MDINQLLRDSCKNTATAAVDEMFREPEPDHSMRQVDALEKIAENMLNRVDIAERELALYKKQLAMYAKQIADAEKEAKAAARRSRIAIGVSIVAIFTSIAGAVLGAAISAGWIQLAILMPR